MKMGTVKEYDTNKGFGFISDEDEYDYFVHVSGLMQHLQSKGLRQGQRVMFDVQFDVKGDRAVNVKTVS